LRDRSLKAITIAAVALIYTSEGGAQEMPVVRKMRFAAKTPAEARKWQNACRQKLFALMMGGGRPAKIAPDVKVLQRIEMPAANYALEEITLQTLPDRRVHCWMALPVEPKHKVGGVLAIHGHGGTGEQVVKGEGLYWYGRHIAELGYPVIAPDVGSHELQHPHWTLMGERVWDCLCAANYLAARPEVDGKRMAVVGLSLGGETTMYVGALDERFALVGSSGWLTTIANMKGPHCPCWSFPGLEESFEFADIFACVAPRRLICENGQKEPEGGGFPLATAKKTFPEIQRAYEVFGAKENAQLDIHPGGHVFSGRLFLGQLREALGRPG
jgi:dienelactone hydrolase